MAKNKIMKAPTIDIDTMAPEQIDLIKRTVAKGATDDELKLFLYDCRRQNVHPLDKLLHFIKRKDGDVARYVPTASIDLLRSRAEETGEYAGCDEVVFIEGKERPEKATVTVYRIVKGQRCAFTASARWSEFYPGDKLGFMWRSKPHVMLAKCAEAQALRKAFPKQLREIIVIEESFDIPTNTEERKVSDQVDAMTGGAAGKVEMVGDAPTARTTTTQPTTAVVIETTPAAEAPKAEPPKIAFDPNTEKVGFGAFAEVKWINLPMDALIYFKGNKNADVAAKAVQTIAIRGGKDVPDQTQGATAPEGGTIEAAITQLEACTTRDQLLGWFKTFGTSKTIKSNAKVYKEIMAKYRTKIEEVTK